MSDIFLSYKSEDREKAQMIAAALEQIGYSVWWDRVIPPGRTYDEVIEEELNTARCVIVLWSKESVKSDWVKEEADEGIYRRILVPALIDNVKPPMGFRRIQAANLTDWKGELDHTAFKLLLRSIANILGHPAGKEKEVILPSYIKQKQEQEALLKKETFTNSIGMKFVLIPE